MERETKEAVAVADMIRLMLAKVVEVWSPLVGALGMEVESGPISPERIQKILKVMRLILDEMRKAQRNIHTAINGAPGMLEVFDLLRYCFSQQQPAIDQNGISVLWPIPTEPVVVTESGSLPGMVITAVLENAIEALGEKPAGLARVITVLVNPKQANGLCRITIHNNGKEIDGHGLRVLGNFPFVASKDRVGLSLFVAKHILAACGGNLTLESEAGKGVAVHIDLPLAKTE